MIHRLFAQIAIRHRPGHCWPIRRQAFAQANRGSTTQGAFGQTTLGGTSGASPQGLGTGMTQGMGSNATQGGSGMSNNAHE